MSIVIEQLVKRLQRHPKPTDHYGPVQKRAAVAIVMRESDDQVELLMIRRAQRVGDPWSGHMGFPGGRRDREDHSDFDCALRETREEVGLDLAEHGSLICELGDVNTGWRPDRPEMLVTPYVFLVDEMPPLTLNHEVDSVLWVPLAFLLDRSNRVLKKWEWRGEKLETDSYIFDRHQIWGLSLMMIDELLEAAER